MVILNRYDDIDFGIFKTGVKAYLQGIKAYIGGINMARKSLAEIRTQLKKEAANEGKSTFVNDGASYPFWNIPLNSTAVTRFLPDGNEENTEGFWVERLMINLEFTGVKGDPTRNDRIVLKVPCVEMYMDGSTCPVQAEIKPWYKDPAMEEAANKYWKKRSYLYQGFVVEHPGFVDRNGNPIEDNTPENPIRRFVINPGLHKEVKKILLDPQLDAWPDDYEDGLNFNIRKVQDGKWASYDDSFWDRKPSALTDEQLAAVEEHGLKDLRDFLPNKPSDTELKVIMEMFEASVDGEEYDPEKWAAYYRPWGVEKPEGMTPSTPKKEDEATPSATTTTESKDDDSNEVPFDNSTKVADTSDDDDAGQGSSSDRAADILSKIRSRKTA